MRFGPVGNTDKKNLVNYEELFRVFFFSYFQGLKNHLDSFLNIAAFTSIPNQLCIALLETPLLYRA